MININQPPQETVIVTKVRILLKFEEIADQARNDSK